MKLEFTANINLENINDSMELDSGQVVAQLKMKDEESGKDITVTLEVQGHVKVYYKDGMYKCASQMPEELIKLFHDGYESETEHDLSVIENNWFEIYIEEPDQCLHSDVAYPEGMNRFELLAMMIDVYKDYFNDYEQSK